MSKKEDRKKYIEIRKNMPETLKRDKSLRICEEVRKIVEKGDFEVLLLYAPLTDEVDVFPLFETFKGKVKTAFPRVIGDNMDFYIVNDEKDLETGSFNVREPKEYSELISFEADKKYICIVPGVSFDKKGARIGYGKGYYDKFFTRYKDKNIYKLGVCFDECFSENIESDEFDVFVDKVMHF